MSERLCKCSLFVFVMACAACLHAQSAPIPIKPGLWQTQISGTNSMSMSPDMEAKIAAMPAAQQSMIRSRMGGTPTTTTTRSCAAQQTSLNAIMSEAQQKNTKCTFTNQTQTAGGASFDVSCVSQQGTASGHAQFQMTDSEHVSGSIHLTADGSSPNGGSMHMTIDNTVTSKYMGADCGTVKPGAGEVVHP